MDERVFNYRLSGAHRVFENSFGIATTRFRIFRRLIIATEKKVIKITKAVVAIHTLLMSKRQTNDVYNCFPTNHADQDSPIGIDPGEWRHDTASDGLTPNRHTGSNNYSKNAKQVRYVLKIISSHKEVQIGIG